MNRIKYLRDLNNLTQEELGKEINRAKSTISEYENGLKTPSMETLIKLSKIFNVSVDYILGIEEEQNINNLSFAFSKDSQEDLTPEDIEEVKQFIEFIKNKKEKK